MAGQTKFRRFRQRLKWQPTLGAVMVGVVVAVTATAEIDFLSWAYWQQSTDGTSRSEVLRNVGLLIAAFGAAIIASWRAITASAEAKTSELGLATDRFGKATEQLGHTHMAVRLGGIYALWHLAEDNPARYRDIVIDTLSAFVRAPTHDATIDPDAPKLREDAQAILTLLTDPNSPFTGTKNLDFSHANLTDARLNGAKLIAANLWNTDLTKALLVQADLTNANLTQTNFTGARLWYTNFAKAFLLEANLAHANLDGAEGLTKAKLAEAKNVPPNTPTVD